MELTLEKLKSMEPGIFDEGTVMDSPEGINMANSGKILRWVAVRGGVHDWAIYCHFADRGKEWIRDQGDKVTGEHNIKKLMACTDEAFKMYRY